MRNVPQNEESRKKIERGSKRAYKSEERERKKGKSKCSLTAATGLSRYGRATNESSLQEESANGNAPLYLASTTAVSKLETAAASQSLLCYSNFKGGDFYKHKSNRERTKESK